MTFDPKALIEKLNPLCRGGLERAAELCARQTHPRVEVEHFLFELLDAGGTDLERVLGHFGVSPPALLRELAVSMEGLPRGGGAVPTLSPQLARWVERGWLFASLHLGEGSVRSGALLLALVEDEGLRSAALRSCPGLGGVPREPLLDRLPALVRDSPEAGAGAGDGAGAAALERFTLDLTAEARAGRLDPVRGRDEEIRQVVDVLLRRRQNNPILTGEAGVGKTAVVEGFALRVAEGSVPPALRGAAVRALDLGALQAGAGVRGEFEERLRAVIEGVRASPHTVILFIDEAHTLIGAGAAEGQGDAANLLKPALARGELRTIAATTWSEYKRYVEKDPALARRFQVVRVEEPDEERAVEMLRGVVPHLERHHGVRVLDEAVRDAVRLSGRHIAGRQLPDKAVSVLDTACARVAVGRHGPPAALEAVARRIEREETELAALRREQASGARHAGRIARLEAALERGRAERARLEGRWRAELEAVAETERLRERVEAEGGDGGAARELAAAERELAALQGEDPLVPGCVASRTVASVISGWTGIPLGKILKDEVRTVLGLRRRLADRIVGQPEALETIARRIRTFRASLDDPDKPVGVFLLVGPGGVGKTETALALAEHLYGGERNLVTVNMSEYQEAHTVSLLRGAPPGYVGYGRGGTLTEAVRRRPHCVVLLDEAEKAHADVLELFHPVFDRGRMEDGEGSPVDFRNAVVFLTSSAGSEVVAEACRGGVRPDPEALAERLAPHLLRRFRPSLLARLVVVPFLPLGEAEIREVAELKLAEVQRRFWEAHRAELTFDDAVVDTLVDRCAAAENGARGVDRAIAHGLLPGLSAAVLERLARGEEVASVHLSLDPRGGFVYELDGVPSAA
ncbi:MAG TPA: type VI secretion system ATPase TssH [Longimicrobiaceae bacterium]